MSISALCAAAFGAAEPLFIGAGPEAGSHPCIVRRRVVNDGRVVSAIWRVTGLGVFNPIVNGRDAAPGEVLLPGFTHFKKRRQEVSLDVTGLWLADPGATNEVSALATGGWWCDAISARAGGSWPAFRGALSLIYADGSRAEIATDESWQVSLDTPQQAAGIWEGEVYDSRIEPKNWRPAVVSREFDGEVSPRIGGGVVLRHDLRMEGGSFDLKAGETKIFDFGQNCAALPLLRVRGASGVKVSVRLAEMLNDGVEGHKCDGPAGSLYLANMRGLKAGFDYVCNGAGAWGYMPSETFFGYRYASVSADGPVEGHIASIPVSSVSRQMEHGYVTTGDENVNKLVSAARFGMLSNYLSVPTDCPQRNERLGWTGDTQVFSKTACYFADVADFLRKWTLDVRDSQASNGVVPTVAPPGPFGGGGPVAGWSDAVVIVPHRVWRYLGDERIVRENWGAMMRFVDYVASTGYAIETGGVLCDWLSFERLTVNQRIAWNKDAITPGHRSYQLFLNACHLLGDIRMMREMGRAVAGVATGDELARLARFEREAESRLLSGWFTPEGDLVPLFDGMQTPALFALKLSLGDRARISSRLVAAIRANGGRLSTGFLGTPLLCEVLSEIGEPRIAYSLLLERGFPGWLYTIDQGATTMWERWNSYTRERGFGDAGMNSFNHYAYGAVAAWLFEHAAGLSPGAEAGWRDFTVAPEPDERLGFCRAWLDAGRGKMVSEWRFTGEGSVAYRIVVPEGTSATVRLAGREPFVLGPGDHAF